MAKKRYYQSAKDRLAESRGEERHLYRKMMSKKGGMDPRRSQEMKDYGMISEDHNATANLPQDVKYHAWPKGAGYIDDKYLDDTIRGIDRQMDEDEDIAERHLNPGKY